eukprot:scaffold141050_cov27-Tisochrysis_lutea.AAC.1
MEQHTIGYKMKWLVLPSLLALAPRRAARRAERERERAPHSFTAAAPDDGGAIDPGSSRALEA